MAAIAPPLQNTRMCPRARPCPHTDGIKLLTAGAVKTSGGELHYDAARGAIMVYIVHEQLHALRFDHPTLFTPSALISRLSE